MRPAALLICALILAPVDAGVFNGADSADFPNFIITHSPGFDGTGGELVVRLCVDAGSEQLIEPLRRAIQTWNDLVPQTSNCTGCLVAEETDPNPDGLLDPQSTLLHEVGHCAMGLEHPNWPFRDMGSVLETSFTNSNDATVFLEGDDEIPGTFDDRPFPFPGTRLIHWFRTADNNPVVVDGVVIDENTFTRTLTSLPAGHTWAANANRRVSETLGAPDTHSVMYSERAKGAVYGGLTADEVNTVRMAMTGLDKIAGTADDYTVLLQLTTGCDSQDDIRVRFATPPDIQETTLGQCVAGFRAVPDPPNQTQHYAMSNEPFNFPMEIKLNANQPWDFSRLFSDGFETGALDGWDAVVP